MHICIVCSNFKTSVTIVLFLRAGGGRCRPYTGEQITFGCLFTSKSNLPAAKKKDAARSSSFPASNSNDSLAPPDLCMSESAKLEPMDQALLEEAADAVLCATSSRDAAEQQEDFDRSMFDAPHWI
ncbi:hypothetical protein ACA910_016884 [Epithemia clementina (nom. ined.)]